MVTHRTSRWLSAGVALVAVVLAAVFFFLSGDEEPPSLARGGEPLPVVLVHGYGGSSGSMSAIEERLRTEGRQVVSVELPEGGVGDIAASARVVQEAVTATGSQTVDLIGFSMGGLVVRTYISELGGATRARYVVTLASPHHGTSVAGFAAFTDPDACTGACAQMAPDSTFLSELNESDETPEGPAFVTVWTDQDETVTPPESAELDGALNIKIQEVCPNSSIGHGEVVTDPAVLGIIVETLSGRLRDVPDSERCEALGALGRSS